MTAPLAAPAPAGGGNPAEGTLPLCRLCRGTYRRTRPNQEFCCPEHKRAWEELMREVSAAVVQAVAYALDRVQGYRR